MPGDVWTLRVGALTVTSINVDNIPETIGKLLDAPKSEQSPADAAALGRTEILPVQCILVQGPGVAVLVDAGASELPRDPERRATYQPLPSLESRLTELGVQPEGVEHVVITHAHGDHFNGTTVARGADLVPTFANAQVHVGRADLVAPRMQDALAVAGSLESRTFGVLQVAGLLDPVEGDRELGPGVRIIAAPGETTGHQILRVSSEGQTLYCVGDLYHHPLEVEHETWMVPWAVRDANVASRRTVAEAALAEDARLIATHIPGVGRLKRTDSGVIWVAD